MALIACEECNGQVSDRAVACPHCGAPVATPLSMQTAPQASLVTFRKSRSVAALLAIFLGGLGIHKFYLDRPGWGVIYILFCWTFIPALIGIFEGISYILMREEDFQKKYGLSSRRRKPGTQNDLEAEGSKPAARLSPDAGRELEKWYGGLPTADLKHLQLYGTLSSTELELVEAELARRDAPLRCSDQVLSPPDPNPRETPEDVDTDEPQAMMDSRFRASFRQLTTAELKVVQRSGGLNRVELQLLVAELARRELED